jgi:hypothetical protein
MIASTKAYREQERRLEQVDWRFWMPVGGSLAFLIGTYAIIRRMKRNST